MSIEIGVITKIIGMLIKAKEWILNIFWLIGNATKVRKNINKLGADKPCPVCGEQMAYTKKEQDFTINIKQEVTYTRGRYWLYHKCKNELCAFKDEVPFRYATW